MKILYYPQSGTKEQVEEFYEEARRIENEAIHSTGKWDGDGSPYFITTYTMKNGNKIEYWQEMDLGIPSSIKYLDEE